MKMIYDSAMDAKFIILKKKVKQAEILVDYETAGAEKLLNESQIDFFNHVKKKIAEVLAAHKVIEAIEDPVEHKNGKWIVTTSRGYGLSGQGYSIQKIMDPATMDFKIYIEETHIPKDEMLDEIESNRDYYGEGMREGLLRSRGVSFDK